MGLGPVLGQVSWFEKLRRTLVRQRGARLGEATIVSRQVHVSASYTPQVITVLSTADAGQTFYGRERRGDIIHLDIFHAVSEVDHRRVAAALTKAMESVALAPEGAAESQPLLDFFDVLTATGGGRVTGDLSHGRKTSLRAAHRNHVHLAGLLPDEMLWVLLPMISAVEEAIAGQGIELRRVEKLNHARWSDSAPLDLSHYTDTSSDSLLRGKRQGDGQGAGHGRGGSAGQGHGAGTGDGQGGPGAAQSLRSTRGSLSAESGNASGLPSPAAHADPGYPGQGAVPSGEAGPLSSWDELEAERRLQTALELSRRLGSPDEVKRILDELSREQGWASLYGSGSSQAPFVIRQLEDDGLVRRDIRGLHLTDAGKELAAYLGRHLRDVKLRFRKLIRRIPSSSAKRTRRPGVSTSKPSPDIRYGQIRGTAPAEPGSWLGDVAVPETVRAALKRTRLEQIEAGRAPTGLRLARHDVHVYLRSGEQPLNICLLVDASASMAGRRILAAKHLARHLLVSTRDRIAVISFQERDVRVHVPFTRDWGQVEDGLSRIQPMGLTPLAHGLTQSLDLISESRVKRPLLLLITDGIPTVPKWTIDPLVDALEAARQVGVARVPFGCIGLQPSKRYLEELVRAAGGTLHVVDELDEEALVTIAHAERQRLAQKAR